jgi:hypothetical protein
MTMHMRDSKMTFGKGFMMYAIKINPRLLASLTFNDDAKLQLSQCFKLKGFSDLACDTIK